MNDAATTQPGEYLFEVDARWREFADRYVRPALQAWYAAGDQQRQEWLRQLHSDPPDRQDRDTL